jgi:hypothetical protein
MDVDRAKAFSGFASSKQPHGAVSRPRPSTSAGHAATVYWLQGLNGSSIHRPESSRQPTPSSLKMTRFSFAGTEVRKHSMRRFDYPPRESEK